MADEQSDKEKYNIPVEQGDEVEVTIQDMGSKGDGIARIDGFVVFVPETEIGERVKVKIDTVGRKFGFATVEERLGMDEGDEEPEEDPFDDEDDKEPDKNAFEDEPADDDLDDDFEDDEDEPDNDPMDDPDDEDDGWL